MNSTPSILPPVPTDLAAAVASAPTIASTLTNAGPGGTEPDFAAIFALPEHLGPLLEGECAAESDSECPGCTAVLTPRTAWLLKAGADLVFHTWVRHVLDPWRDDNGLNLPPVAQRHCKDNTAWEARMAATVRDLGLRVVAGQVPYPRCTAEEMALHVTLDAAQDFLDIFLDQGMWKGVAALPERGRADTQPADAVAALRAELQVLQDILFEDHDVLMLFEPELDGIESDADVIDRMGLANLHPKDWFLPFRTQVGASPRTAERD